MLIHRANVQAAAAANALQRFDRLRICQDAAAPVIQQHQVERFRPVFALGSARAGNQGSVGRNLLAGSAARQQLEQHGERFPIGDDFVNPHHRHVHPGQSCAHAPIAFVGNDHQRAGLGDQEVGSRYAHLRSQELLPERAAGDLRQPFGVGRGIHPQFFLEQPGDLLFGQMHCRDDDVRGAGPRQLDDVLPQVSLVDGYAGLFQGPVQADLLGRHGFDLHRGAHLMRRGDLQHDTTGFRGIGCPVHLPAGGGDLRFQLLQVNIQVLQGVQAQLMRCLAQFLPLRQFRDPQLAGPQEAVGRLLYCGGDVCGHICAVPAEIYSGGGSAAHSISPFAARTSIRCIAFTGALIFCKPPPMFIRQPASLTTTTSAPVSRIWLTLVSIIFRLTSG